MNFKSMTCLLSASLLVALLAGWSAADPASTQPATHPHNGTWGIVSMEKYTALREDRDRLAELCAKLQGELQAARAEAQMYKSQLEALQNKQK
jgi:hypothetical protein